MDILEKISRAITVFDGAMGTMLQQFLKPGELPERLNIDMPDAVKNVHRAYLDAGCDVIETNTLNANRRKLGDNVDSVVTAAVMCAKRAISESGREAFVALSMGSLGAMLEPLGDLKFEEAYEMYREMAVAGERAGADMILIETVSDLYEIKAAVLAAKTATRLPVGVTMTFMTNGRLLTGANVMCAAMCVTALGVDMIGFNCGLGPAQMLDLLADLREATHLPILINPNAGLPKLVNGNAVYAVSPDEFAREAKKLVEGGAAAIGGCCGTTPEHIRALNAAIAGMPPAQKRPRAKFMLTSGSKLFIPADTAVEAEMTDEKDIDDIVDFALESDADVICVAHGRLAELVASIQESSFKPLILLSQDFDNLSRAARIYNGKPMIGIANVYNFFYMVEIAKENGAALLFGEAPSVDYARDMLIHIDMDKSDVCFLCDKPQLADAFFEAGLTAAYFDDNNLRIRGNHAIA